MTALSAQLSRPSSDLELEHAVHGIVKARNSDWSEHYFKSALVDIAATYGLKRIMEIGGGRCPIFSSEEIAAQGWEYTISDISESELARAPETLRKRCFDIGGSSIPSEGEYDLLFSRKVFEHLPDTPQAYRNCFRLLAPGGVAFHFFPTLFCPPIVMNWILPEQISSKVLRFFQPHRNPEGEPKFPSYYRWCTASEDLRQRVLALGFSEVTLTPFYGHHYFDNVPGLNILHPKIRDFCLTGDIRTLASRAWLIARK